MHNIWIVTVFYFPVCPTQPMPEEFIFIFSFTGFLFYFFLVTYHSGILTSEKIQAAGNLGECCIALKTTEYSRGVQRGRRVLGGWQGRERGPVQRPQIFICMVPLCSPKAELRGWYCKHLKTEFCTGISAQCFKSGSSSAVSRVLWVCSMAIQTPRVLAKPLYSSVVAVTHISLTWDFSAHRTAVVPFKIIWAVSYTIVFLGLF